MQNIVLEKKFHCEVNGDNLNICDEKKCIFLKKAQKKSLDDIVQEFPLHLFKYENLRVFYKYYSWNNFYKTLPGNKKRNSLKDKKSVSPKEQLDNLINCFLEDSSYMNVEEIGMYPSFKLMNPKDRLVWEIRTKDTRTFGWFSDINKFVAVCGGHVSIFKEENKSKNDVYLKFQCCSRSIMNEEIIGDCISSESDLKILLTNIEKKS